MPEGHHCTRTGHPLSVGGYFLCGTHDFENRGPVQNGGIQCGQPGYLTPYSPVLHDFAEQKEIKDLCAAPYAAVFRHADGSPQDRPRALIAQPLKRR